MGSAMTLRNLTVGLEEEFFLVYKDTGDLCKQWPKALWQVCNVHFPEQIVREFISGQVELVSKPANSIAELHQESYLLRGFLVEQAERFGLAPMACATHPKAKWHEQKPTISERYQRLAQELKISAERLLVCGMHVHVGIEDLALRLRVMNEMNYYLPIILSLSSSSPFWGGQDTGSVSYRAAVLSSLPRAGLPPIFSKVEDYRDYLKLMVDSGAIESGKELWWDLRLSARFPTVEMRAADTCTSHQDVMAIVSFIKSLATYIIDSNPLSDEMLEIRALCARENRWRGQRFSINEGFILEAIDKQLKPISDIVSKLVDILLPYAHELGCAAYLSHCKTICQRGTSADIQRQIYNKALASGLSNERAADAVSQYLINETAKYFPVNSDYSMELKTTETA